MGVRRERQGSSEERDVETEAGPRVSFCLEMTKFWEEGWLQLVATNRELETVRHLSCAFKDLRTEGRPGGESGAPAPPGSGFCRLRSGTPHLRLDRRRTGFRRPPK